MTIGYLKRMNRGFSQLEPVSSKTMKVSPSLASTHNGWRPIVRQHAITNGTLMLRHKDMKKQSSQTLPAKDYQKIFQNSKRDRK